MARLQKIKDVGYNVVSIWGCEFRKLLLDIPDLEIELCSYPCVKKSAICKYGIFSVRHPIVYVGADSPPAWI